MYRSMTLYYSTYSNTFTCRDFSDKNSTNTSKQDLDKNISTTYYDLTGAYAMKILNNISMQKHYSKI